MTPKSSTAKNPQMILLLVIKRLVDKMGSFLESGSFRFPRYWMTNLRQQFHLMLYLNIKCFRVQLFTSPPYYLDTNSHSFTVLSLFPLGRCKSLTSIQLLQVFYTKGRIKSNQFPKASSFCVFSCGYDKRLKTFWHRPWAFAGYCNPFMVSWILFEKFSFSFFSWMN